MPSAPSPVRWASTLRTELRNQYRIHRADRPPQPPLSRLPGGAAGPAADQPGGLDPESRCFFGAFSAFRLLLTWQGDCGILAPVFRTRGGIGRHVRFRFLWREPWGFKSLRVHHFQKMARVKAYRFHVRIGKTAIYPCWLGSGAADTGTRRPPPNSPRNHEYQYAHPIRA